MNALHEQILQLSVADRLQLIAFIASSISPETVQSNSVEVPDAWIDEALSRDAAFVQGKSQGYSWDEVKRRVRGEK